MAEFTQDEKIAIFRFMASSKLITELTEQTSISTDDNYLVINKGTDDAVKVKIPLVRGVNGGYNANTNTPSLSNGTGLSGDLYTVTVAGSRDFGNGAIDLLVDDVIWYNGSKYVKLTQTQVSDITGLQGVLNGFLLASNNLSDVDDVSISRANLAAASLNGDSTEKFKVADAVLSTEAINKGIFDAAITALQGALTPQGNWDADTNTPDISGTTDTGYYWIVSVDGTTDIGGITDWVVNDWAVKTATGWAKVDNTDKVVSVAGQTGAVVLDLDDVADSTTRKALTNGTQTIEGDKIFEDNIIFSGADSYIEDYQGELLVGSDFGGYYLFTGNQQYISKPIFIGDNASYFRITTKKVTRYEIDEIDSNHHFTGEGRFSGLVKSTQSVAQIDAGVGSTLVHKDWINAQGFSTGSSGVDLTTDQDIGGVKTFLAATEFQGNLFTYGDFYTRNKANNAFIKFLDRNTTGSETVIDLSNIGTITADTIDTDELDFGDWDILVVSGELVMRYLGDIKFRVASTNYASLTIVHPNKISGSELKYKKINDRLIIRGSFGKTTGDTSFLVATLPVGFRPDELRVFLTTDNSDTAVVHIQTDGEIRMYGMSSTVLNYYDLDFTMLTAD